MSVTCGFLVLVLLVGLIVPTSFLNRFSRKQATVKVVKTVDGKQVVETLNPSTGQKVVETTDPNTGQKTIQSIDTNTGRTTTTVANKDGQVISVATSTDGNQPLSPGSPTESPTSVGTAPSSPQPSPTPQPGGGGTPTPTAKPVVSISISPSSITQGSSATLGWSASNNPASCSASGGWTGTKAASGTQSISPSSTTTYTLSCSNNGGSAANSAKLTVNTPVAGCGSGGVCHIADIQDHNRASDCRSAINANDSPGMEAYFIPSGFLGDHYNEASEITSQLCGKVYSGNLRDSTGGHQNGRTIGGKNYDQWMNNLYIGPYN